MTINHVDISDPNVHEPKGVSTATANKVYVSDGAGSGSWQRVAYDYAYGSMTITNNTTAFAVTAGDLADNNDYSLFTGTGAPLAGESLESITFSVDRLTVPFTGIYEIITYANISGFPSSTAKVGIKYKINNTTFSTRSPIIKSAVSSAEAQIIGCGLISLTANDYLQFRYNGECDG